MKKGLFLDRDGVVNIDKGYVFEPENFIFNKGIFELCRAFQERDYLIFIITNQSGIARGYYSEEDFHTLTEWMLGEFDKEAIAIADVAYCPHHPTRAVDPKYLLECECRKPKPRMITQLIEQYNLDATACILIGDRLSDIIAGKSAGILHNLLLNGQYHQEKGFETLEQITLWLETKSAHSTFEPS